jgi:hypothetical protein
MRSGVLTSSETHQQAFSWHSASWVSLTHSTVTAVRDRSLRMPTKAWGSAGRSATPDMKFLSVPGTRGLLFWLGDCEGLPMIFSRERLDVSVSLRGHGLNHNSHSVQGPSKCGGKSLPRSVAIFSYVRAQEQCPGARCDSGGFRHALRGCQAMKCLTIRH